ncbi:type II toxin-antitoxin system death-on-curing family toxin [Methylovirgula sp. HY1]|uniref:type II toxin-antitoxin system death-on-curing family toxin n=1 Tax=Methylovirgula sp. HY1 TaxID=2822761 RepID=UPI001C5B9AFD|nr:type II toxin-antitoxin system death-on-curing family toxin [Methylovirgula sp. HY1]QXX75993.1 Toxin Doc [Methylovirgula sp. HY1]
MNALRFLDRDIILAIHEEQLAQHGGRVGIRDEGLLESALTRPVNRAAYDPATDIATFAAAYAFGLAKNHPFLDGNKRSAYVAMELFLLDNGFALLSSDEDSLLTTLKLAAGEMGEEEYAAWIRDKIVGV